MPSFSMGIFRVSMDSMPNSYNIGPEQFLERITSNTKAVIVVHALGQACDIRTIVEEAHKCGLKVIEDCSQAHGAKVMGRPVGNVWRYCSIFNYVS